MDHEFDWQKALDFACNHLATLYPRDSLKQELSDYSESISADDPGRALRTLEVIGENTAPTDHNFWSYLEGTASQLGLKDLADEYLHRHYEAYVDTAVAMPDNCRGLPTVNLMTMAQASLIILAPSGVAYWNQTCGNACGQRAEEGIVVPLIEPAVNDKKGVIECPLVGALAELHWGPVLGIDQKRAADIDAILNQFYWTRGLSVDQNRLGESEEAWVYLELNPKQFRLAIRLKWTKAVLAWPNSD